jgi:uncharacterized membrane protein YfcA
MEPRKVIGSIDTSEFLVSIAASAGFFLSLGSAGIDWKWVAALLVGGVVAAPIAAWLVRVIPPRILGSAVGGLIVVTNVRSLLRHTALGGTPAQAVVLAFVVAVWVAAIAWSVRAWRRDEAAETAELEAIASSQEPVIAPSDEGALASSDERATNAAVTA